MAVVENCQMTVSVRRAVPDDAPSRASGQQRYDEKRMLCLFRHLTGDVNLGYRRGPELSGA